MAKQYQYTDHWHGDQKKTGRLNNAMVSPLREKQTITKSGRVTKDVTSGRRYAKKNT